MIVNIAVLGAGHWGPNLIRTLHDRQSSAVSWVIDSNQERLIGIQSRFPDVRVSTKWEDAIRDPSVDGVAVVTPTSTHYELARAALEADKHVFVEKPLTADVASSTELVQLAESKQLILLVGHLFLYNAAVQRVKQYLEDGELGRVYYISMVRTNLGPIRRDVNASWDLASHDVSIANYWLGNEPLKASALGGTWINEGVEDAVFATLRYPNEVLVNLHVSWLSPRKSRDVTLVGETRMMTFDDMSLVEPIRIYDKGVSEHPVTSDFADTFGSFRASVREGDITIPKIGGEEPLRAECADFIDAIRFNRPPRFAPERAISVVRTLKAIERSLHSGGAEIVVQSV